MISLFPVRAGRMALSCTGEDEAGPPIVTSPLRVTFPVRVPSLPVTGRRHRGRLSKEGIMTRGHRTGPLAGRTRVQSRPGGLIPWHVGGTGPSPAI